MEIKELKVSKQTEPKKLAGTLKYYLSKGGECNIMALGQVPICIAVKSLALLTSMFNVKYQCSMSYFNQQQADDKISGIRFTVKNA